jgi:hypothetical protein
VSDAEIVDRLTLVMSLLGKFLDREASIADLVDVQEHLQQIIDALRSRRQ